jgi:hypothetical protein
VTREEAGDTIFILAQQVHRSLLDALQVGQDAAMAEHEHNCPQCPWRAKYDKNPRSFLGRLWHLHARICPGWSAYMRSLPADERNELARRYGFKKFQIPRVK